MYDAHWGGEVIALNISPLCVFVPTYTALSSFRRHCLPCLNSIHLNPSTYQASMVRQEWKMDDIAHKVKEPLFPLMDSSACLLITSLLKAESTHRTVLASMLYSKSITINASVRQYWMQADGSTFSSFWVEFVLHMDKGKPAIRRHKWSQLLGFNFKIKPDMLKLALGEQEGIYQLCPELLMQLWGKLDSYVG